MNRIDNGRRCAVTMPDGLIYRGAVNMVDGATLVAVQNGERMTRGDRLLVDGEPHSVIGEHPGSLPDVRTYAVSALTP